MSGAMSALAAVQNYNNLFAAKIASYQTPGFSVNAEEFKEANAVCFGSGNQLWYSPNGSGLNLISAGENPYYAGLNRHCTAQDPGYDPETGEQMLKYKMWVG